MFRVIKYHSVSKYSGQTGNCPKNRLTLNNTIPPLFHEDFDLLREQVVESEIEDGSDIELDDLLVRI